jgi:hypothetical protein
MLLQLARGRPMPTVRNFSAACDGRIGLAVLMHVNRVLRLLRDERIVRLEKHCLSIFDLGRPCGLAQAAV